MEDTMRTDWTSIKNILVDPVTRETLTLDSTETQLVAASGSAYDITDGQPVLLSRSERSSSSWLFQPVEPIRHSTIRNSRRLPQRVLNAAKRRVRFNVRRDSTIDKIATHLSAADNPAPIVLVVGGGSVGLGSSALAGLPGVRLVSFDVYASPDTTLVADAHQIPLESGSIDVVWIQAVLEHVVEPTTVVAEITRVLTSTGMICAETPFLQPVHEGAYDFTRFTQSGHRLLFGDYDEVVSVPLGGPGALAALAFRGVIGGLTRSHRAARVAYGLTAWMTHIDRAIPPTWRSDFATGIGFLGMRRDSPNRFDALDEYRGAQ